MDTPDRGNDREKKNGVFAGLDVSLAETAICVVDETGKILCEAVCPTEPAELIAWFEATEREFERIGFEAGACSAWLYRDFV